MNDARFIYSLCQGEDNQVSGQTEKAILFIQTKEDRLEAHGYGEHEFLSNVGKGCFMALCQKCQIEFIEDCMGGLDSPTLLKLLQTHKERMVNRMAEHMKDVEMMFSKM